MTIDAAASPSASLASIGIRPRKSRGQNFLVQRRIAERIVKAAQIEVGDSVIEIGPGLGILTDALQKSPAARITLVEVDSSLASMLQSRFVSERRISMVNRDFLSLDVADLPAGPVKVVANLPFNVATAILERLCEFRDAIASMVLMFQREVGQRIRARPGSRDYGMLSAFTALYWKVTDHCRVAAGSFYPKPSVDAEVLTMHPQYEVGFSRSEEAAIRATIRAAFSAPRKTVRNSLASGLGIEVAASESALRRAGIDPTSRASSLDARALIALANSLGPLPLRGGRNA